MSLKTTHLLAPHVLAFLSLLIAGVMVDRGYSQDTDIADAIEQKKFAEAKQLIDAGGDVKSNEPDDD